MSEIHWFSTNAPNFQTFIAPMQIESFEKFIISNERYNKVDTF